jgi:hypothetical protein
MADYKFESSRPRDRQRRLIVGFSISQFSEVFNIRDNKGQPYVLIGGQAVNYWAERYLPDEPELKHLQPFTSQDIDFKGSRDDVQYIAQQLHSSPGYPPKVAMTALAGIIPVQIAGQKTNIEVVRQIPGVSDSARIPAIEAQWQEKMIRVLNPISLLASKLELAATVPQRNRQDVSHVKILLLCVRAFLRELLQEVELGRLEAKDWLKVANQALKLSTNGRSRKIAAKYQIDCSGILPLKTIEQNNNEKIKRFRKLQLEKSYKSPRGARLKSQ